MQISTDSFEVGRQQNRPLGADFAVYPRVETYPKQQIPLSTAESAFLLLRFLNSFCIRFKPVIFRLSYLEVFPPSGMKVHGLTQVAWGEGSVIH